MRLVDCEEIVKRSRGKLWPAVFGQIIVYITGSVQIWVLGPKRKTGNRELAGSAAKQKDRLGEWAVVSKWKPLDKFAAVSELE